MEIALHFASTQEGERKIFIPLSIYLCESVSICGFKNPNLDALFNS